MPGTGTEGGLTALVLAGSRAGVIDPMALDAGLSHKALLSIGGVPMLDRVLHALRTCPEIGRVVVSAERAEDLLLACAEGRDAFARPAAASPSRSVATILDEFGPPLLVTTADHALLTPEMLSHFLGQSPGSVDVVAAVARADVVEAAYPQTSRTWLRFRDGRVTGCNIFLLRTGKAAALLSFWQRVEQQRKKPMAIARLVGPVTLLLYAGRTATLPEMLRRLGRRVGATLAAVVMPFAEAAIDVDRPGDLALVREIVAVRDAGLA